MGSAKNSWLSYCNIMHCLPRFFKKNPIKVYTLTMKVYTLTMKVYTLNMKVYTLTMKLYTKYIL